MSKDFDAEPQDRGKKEGDDCDDENTKSDDKDEVNLDNKVGETGDESGQDQEEGGGKKEESENDGQTRQR